MTETRVAGVGAGYFAQFHYDGWRRIDGVDLVALADNDATKAEATARAFAIPRVFDDAATMLDQVRPELVDIITPPSSHLELIKMAAERGIDAICQKPFCEDLQQAREAAAIADAAGISVIVHENFRHQPWHLKIKDILDAGTLGPVHQITFRLRPGDGQGPDAYISRQPYFQQMPRFLIHETGIHFIDVFRFLLGEVETVYADLQRLNPAIAGEDAGLVVFNFASGARAVLDGNRLIDHAAPNPRLTMGEMLVEGEAATLTLNGDGSLWLRPHGAVESHAIVYKWTNHAFGGDCVRNLQRTVIDARVEMTRYPNTSRGYLRNLEVEQAIYQSAETGRRIHVNRDQDRE